MLECRTCVLRCIRAIAGDSVPLANGPLILTPRISNTPSRRRFTTAIEPAPKRDAFGTSYKPEGRAKPKEESSRLTSTTTQRALQAELQYLTDPLKLASHIHYVLRQNDPAKALDLARLASKSARSPADVVVAWNHCVDWHMRSGRVTEAVKIYNEMKKRGVFPDAFTYTMLLRSFIPKVGNGMDAGTVAKATSIYYSMLTPTSRVKPGIIHTNAVLRVCSLANDMDALWGVASRIPEHGPGSADTVTYTILLAAIRYGAMTTAQEGGVYLEQIGGQRQSAVNEGRRIWMECIQKWRGGDLVIDAELVSQMGNLLLISNRMEDWDDVLSLVEQTTKIPRQIPHLGSPDRHIGHVPREKEDRMGEDSTEVAAQEDPDGFLPTPASKAFNAVATNNVTSIAWVQPHNPILNILIRACTAMRIPKAANAYWDLITSPPYNITPDLANCQSMLRLFRLNRSSAKAAALIERMHSREGENATPHGKTYREALAVCARDHKNPSIMSIAMRIVDDMTKHMSYPDVPTLQSFLSLATTTDSGFHISAALDKLDAFVPLVKTRIRGSKGEVVLSDKIEEEDRRTRANGESLDQDDAIAFIKQMAGAIQMVINRGMVPKEMLTVYANRRNILNRNISRAENRNVANWAFEEGREERAKNERRKEREIGKEAYQAWKKEQRSSRGGEGEVVFSAQTRPGNKIFKFGSRDRGKEREIPRVGKSHRTLKFGDVDGHKGRMKRDRRGRDELDSGGFAASAGEMAEK